jgi:hypothetical protein
MKLWAFLAPLLCAGIGICLGVCQMTVNFYEWNRRIKMTEEAFTNNKKRFHANRDDAPEMQENRTRSNKVAAADQEVT